MDLLLVPNDASFTGQTATYTGTAGSTTAFPPHVRAVMVWCTTAAYVRVGVSVTATTADLPLPANVPVLMKVENPTKEPWRVSAIQISSGGSVYAKPVNLANA